MDFSAAVLLFYAILIASVIAPALFAIGCGKHFKDKESPGSEASVSEIPPVFQGVGESGPGGNYFAPLLDRYTDAERRVALTQICSIVNIEAIVGFSAVSKLTLKKARRDVMLFYKRQITDELARNPDLTSTRLVGTLVGVHISNLNRLTCYRGVPRRTPVLHTNN